MISPAGERITARFEEFSEAVAAYRTAFIILGGVLIALGVLAIIFPLASTIAVKVTLGWIIMIGGLAQAFHAFSTQEWSAFFFNLVIGVLYFVVGAWLAFLPLTGIVTLTVMLALLFIAQGVVQAALSIRLKPRDGWGWILVAGIISALSGVLLLAGLPGTGAWAIGLLAGVTMISTGWAYLSIGLRVGALTKAVHTRLS